MLQMQIEERQNDDDLRLSHYPKANAASRLDEQTLDLLKLKPKK